MLFYISNIEKARASMMRQLAVLWTALAAKHAIIGDD
jgi:hypothetical protein